MACLDIRALQSPSLQAAFLHQGVNRSFFVKGKKLLSKTYGNCPLRRINSTDRQKDAKFLRLLRGLVIPAHPPRKTGSTSSIKVSIEISQFLQNFRIETSVLGNFPSES